MPNTVIDFLGEVSKLDHWAEPVIIENRTAWFNLIRDHGHGTAALRPVPNSNERDWDLDDKNRIVGIAVFIDGALSLSDSHDLDCEASVVITFVNSLPSDKTEPAGSVRIWRDPNRTIHFTSTAASNQPFRWVSKPAVGGNRGGFQTPGGFDYRIVRVESQDSQGNPHNFVPKDDAKKVMVAIILDQDRYAVCP